MSIRATLDDSIAAIRTIFDLEDTVGLAADLLRTTLQEAHKVLIHLLCELVEPDLPKE